MRMRVFGRAWLAVAVAGLFLSAASARAQEAPPERPKDPPTATEAKPPESKPAEPSASVKVGVTLFADFTRTSQPKVKDSDGNSVSPDSFNVRRAYINVTGRLGRLISFRVTPDIRLDQNDATVDRSLSGSNVYQLKYAYAQASLDGFLPKGSWVRFGAHQTPYVDFAEGLYRYRFQGPIQLDREGFQSASDYGLSAQVEFPHDYGSAHFGVYNGETYRRIDPNDQKAYAARVSLRPFPKAHIMKGLWLAGFADLDHVVKNAKRNRYVGAGFFEHPRIRAGAEFFAANDQSSATKPVVKASGYSLWATPISSFGLEGLLRYDSLKPDARFTGRKYRLIAGVAYWFRNLGAARTAVLADFESVDYDSTLPGFLVSPKERRFGVRCLVSY